jgi:hypothetical protein
VTYDSNSSLTSAFFLNACSQASFLNRLYFGVCSWGSFGQIKSKVHIMFFKKAVNCELAVPVPNLLFMLAKCDLAISHTYFCQKIKPTRYSNVYQILQIYIGCMSIRKLPIKIVIYYSNFGLLGA